jgi:N-hydroxyarylamine O-acetyltransferase
MDASLDLKAYLDRIEWRGEIRPTLETLAALLDAHMRHVPFENFDVLLGRRVRLDLDGLQDKLVRARRGGYCFEQATLFAAVLEAIGFEPVRHCARVTLQRPRTEAPRTHMFLTVPLAEGRFVVDPGFGSLAPRVPLPLRDRAPTRHGGEVHWMAFDGRAWTLCAQSGDAVVEAWVSTLEQEYPVDFELGNHYTSTHPDSGFRHHIMLRALTPDGRIGVMNRDVTHWRDGTPRRYQLADRAALRALLAEHFGFDLPEVERLRVPAIPEWDEPAGANAAASDGARASVHGR